MYDQVDSKLEFMDRELKILDFWKENQIFEKSVKEREGCPEFSFYEGPPTANGKPHIGHVLTRAIKDLIPRYRTMKGYRVQRKAGWDTHGLPVELEVERKLGINGKEEIEAYGIEAFIQECKKSVWTYRTEWEELSERVAFWADMEHPYVTYENNYIESSWWALKEIWNKGLLYKGHKIVPYCPRCGTALSSHEVAQGYKEVEETSIYVRFKVAGQENTYLSAWTTTPWTLPSNLALAVNGEEEYVLLKLPHDLDGSETDTFYYCAKALAESVFGTEVEIVKTMQGSDLVGLRYEPILPYANRIVAESGKEAWYVIADPFVTLTEGTGIVHIAPAFGEDDARLGRENDLPFVQLVNSDGTLPEDVTDFAGVFVKDADPRIVKKLEKDGSLLSSVDFVHTYPFCWRCHTALIYYARTNWFIRMTDLRDQLIASNNRINWIPDAIGKGRFGNFLETVVDWVLSRERYWGTPLPIWTCTSCNYQHAVGSIAELKEMSDNCPDEIELHKPYIDEVHLNCPKCNSLMKREPEVLDCWFDSGIMPFAQYHYPFENEELFRETYPADFISEAVDQTRGWFYSLHAVSNLIFGQETFKNCIVMGHVLDKNGVKMSKHKGNVVDPWDILQAEGADAVRWYFYVNSQPWLPSRFSAEAVNESKRRFMGTIWNTYAFYVLYANIDKFDPQQYELKYDQLGVMDRWILSRLNTLIREVDKRMENYDILYAARALQDFTDELSNWYVRRSRERFWGPDMPQDKINAYLTLYTVLKQVTLLSAPFIPFMAEDIYQNLVGKRVADAPESVHLADFPVYAEDLINKELERQMKLVLDIVGLGRAARNASSIKNRQPLSEILVVSTDRLTPEYVEYVLDELNIKKLIWLDQASELLDYSFKPQLKVLGKRLGKDIPQAQKLLSELPGQATMAALNEKGYITLDINGNRYDLSKDDLLIEEHSAAGYATETTANLTVALNTTLTSDLIEEGLMREIVSKVQNMRKEAGFEVLDKIKLYYEAGPEITAVLSAHGENISTDVLALEILPLEGRSGTTWDINGHPATFLVEKVVCGNA
ncbi:MAG: isoleucine--tRNA ligase [Saccharofermentanales bacterium]|jgi:isoleucyl-tRNA synthetase|nr:isoleucine--tRNA ligase [Bacillota bacterium]NLB08528.1 isoleucine--tRNA ligase [Clostridiales bacterium]